MTNPTHRVTDQMDPARVQALAATLGLPDGTARPFFHQIYFWAPHGPSDLGQDGHPKVGGLIPDMGLPRRMWAGGRLRFETPITLGQEALRETELLSTLRKTGRTGPLGLVTLRHQVTQNGQLIVSEEQDLIYREADAPKGQPPQAAPDPDLMQTHIFSTTELFRYSALTFNGHRIHYDIDYATQVEGYDGLVVHGPLLAQYLMLMAEDHLGALQTFEFRATAPAIAGEQITFCAVPDTDGLQLWARGPCGRQVIAARAS